MGRTTPSYRVAVYQELERLRELITLMEPCEQRVLGELLEGVEDTISLYTHQIAPIDPFEVILIHILRGVARRLGRDGCEGLDHRC